MKLEGKTALVTGGATGIGLAIAESLSKAGARVAISGRRENKLQEALAQWKGAAPPLTHATDVADRAGVEQLFAWANDKLGRIDILVTSAGVNYPKRTMADMAPETWDQTMNINATGVYNCVRAVLPQMRARHDGLIVIISSVSGKRSSMLGGVAYCASKFAATALATAVALEEGKHGIRVTNILPGEVDTPILEGRPVLPTPEHRARMLRPEDVAEAVLMVACLPPRAHVAELLIKPTLQDYA